MSNSKMSVKSVLMAFVAAGALAVHAEPKIDKLTVRQNWPWSPEVKIEYALTDVNPAEPVDVNVSLFADGASLPYTGSEIAGRRFGVTENGVYTLTVDAQRLLAGRKSIVSLKADVSVSASSVQSQEVLYKIFDLEAATVTNVTRGALLNGDWGSVETDFGRIGPGYNTTLSDVVIWTGVTNDIAYKTTKLVLRKIPAGDFKGFNLGGPPPSSNNMTWTNDYWIGVFELTQKQMALVGTGDQGKMTSLLVKTGDAYPVHAVQNFIMYSSQNGRSAVTGNTNAGFFQKLRDKFKVGDVCPYDFELPTVVQWSRAFRAGTESYYYDGLAKPDNPAQNAQFEALGLYRYNGGVESSVSNVVEVGSFRPNAYGLYDMLGNVREFLRDSGWNFTWPAGSNKTGSIGATNDGYYYGGFFDSEGDGFGVGSMNNYRTAINSVSANRVECGFRVCMQDMAYGLEMVR